MSFPLELGSLQKDGALGTLEKQLICPICLEVFTKPVVILPCQHNLCRKCANELYQVGVGGRFRCPSCRHEVVLDRHGVYGLQRNLLVENIIDVYKQEAANSKPIEQPTCVEHVGEKVNIYCITCQVPTCSLCKVFGAHKSCQVAALSEVYQQQKAELSDGIGSLVATNEQVQAVINELEEVCRSIEETSKSLKQTVCEKFDRMHAILEERRQIMTQRITYEQEEKTGHARSLSSTYGEHVEANLKLVQTAVQTMEEAEMSVFMQSSRTLIEKVNEAASSCTVETLEPGYENMDHYQVDFNAEEQILHQLDFMKIEEEVQDIPEDLELEPDTEVELDSAPSQDINEEPDEDPKVESWETKDPDLETKDNTKEEPIGFIDTKKGAHGDQEGLSTQQGEPEPQCDEHDADDLGINISQNEANGETKLYPSWYKPGNWQFHQPPPLPLPLWMGVSFVHGASENSTDPSRRSFQESSQGCLSLAREDNTDPEDGSSNNGSGTSLSPQGQPLSEGPQWRRDLDTDTFFDTSSDGSLWLEK